MKTEFTTEHTENTEEGDGRRAQKKEMLGPVGSMSNDATPPHFVGNVPYKRLRRVHGFARRWRDVGGNPLKIGPWRIEAVQGAGLTSALRSFAISLPSRNLTLKMTPSGIRQV